MRWVFRLFLLGLIVFLAIQLIPYGKDHSNPLTVQEVKWNSPETRKLAMAACMDCHSNLTSWPWYTNVAPISWLTTRDVNDGRAKLNFSEWQRPQDVDLGDVLEAIRSKGMPPLQYRLIHSASRLSDAERLQLERGLQLTWKADPPGR
jgi:hypothetical protein